MAQSLETVDQKNAICRVPSTIINFLRTHKNGTMSCQYFGPEIGHASHSLHFSLSSEQTRTTRLNGGLWQRVEDQCSLLGTIIPTPEVQSNYVRTLIVEIPLPPDDLDKTLAPLTKLAAHSVPLSEISNEVRVHMQHLQDEFAAPGKLRIVFGEGKPDHLFQWYCQFEFIQPTD